MRRLNVWMILGSLIAIMVLMSIFPSSQPINAQDDSTLTPTPEPITESGDYGVGIQSGGMLRRYLLHIPEGYDPATPMPLVISYHGSTSDPLRNANSTRLSTLADEEGFIVVYPEGRGNPRGWLVVAIDDPDIPTDTQFTRDFIADLQFRVHIDPQRIYATGISNGGGMAHRAACELSDLIAAAVSIAGAHALDDPCEPEYSIAILAIHGYDDPLVLYEGREETQQISIPDWTQAWVEYNGCDPDPESDTSEDGNLLEIWENCAENVVVSLMSYDELGHRWPQDGAQLMWDFVSQFTLDGETEEVDD